MPSWKKEEFVTFGVARSQGIVHKTLYSSIIYWHWLSSILFLPTYCNLLHNPTYFTIRLVLSPLSFAACRRPQLRPTTVQIVYLSIKIIYFISISLNPVNNIRIHIFIPGSRSFIGSFHSKTRPHRLATCHIPSLVGAVMIGGVSDDQAFRSSGHPHKQCAIVEVSYDQVGFPFEAKSGKNSSERNIVHYLKLFERWNMKTDKFYYYQMRKVRDLLERD